MKKEVTVRRYKWRHFSEEKEYVAEERCIDLIINGIPKTSFPISPEELKPFTYGYLFTSGLIFSKEDVKELTIKRHSIDVQIPHLSLQPDPTLADQDDQDDRADRADQKQGEPEKTETKRRGFDQLIRPDIKKLPALYKAFTRYSVLFDETGGGYSAATIFDGMSIMFFSEDMGMRNAVDKVIGKALLNNHVPGSEIYFLMINGRISGEVTAKAIAAGIRGIVSLSAPTSAAVDMAKKCKVSLVGLLSGKSFTIYT
ncbi:MAG: formate dehydrogenase accessory sulfurtransferase FdhD [Candidatus Omnitrophota bacterium]